MEQQGQQGQQAKVPGQPQQQHEEQPPQQPPQGLDGAAGAGQEPLGVPQPTPQRDGRTPPTNPVQPVLHVDAHYIVIDKPADVRIDGDHGHTAVKLLAAALPQHAAELRHCHQLDYATSGVMCYALSKRAASAAGWLFEQRKTKKVYLALVEGHMESATAECALPIADDPGHDFKMMVGTAEVPGRTAYTEVVRLTIGTYRGRPVTKVELHPFSGRRHQLRVHCLSLGHPIVGDATYTEDGESPRMMLHAWKLTLPFSLVPPKRRGVRGPRSGGAMNKRPRHGTGAEEGASTGTGAARASDTAAASASGEQEAAETPRTIDPSTIPGDDITITSTDPFDGFLIS